MAKVDLLALKELGYETRGIEYKRPGKLDDQPLQAKVIRASLSMANRRDGGLIVVGVEDSKGILNWKGLDNEMLASWSKDRLSNILANYADPCIGFNYIEQELEGKQFIIIAVDEFDEVPILCRCEFRESGKRNPLILRKAACYVRTFGKVETSEVATQKDMRDLIELATEKQLRKLTRIVQAAGVKLEEAESDSDKYQRQLISTTSDSEIIEKIKSRGYWEVIIRPSGFRKERITEISQLFPHIRKNAVYVRGWDFPHISNEQPRTGQDWVGQEVSFKAYYESWYLFQSGQFTHYCGFYHDWKSKTEEGILETPDRKFDFIEAIARYFEIFELAVRLGLSELGSEEMTISLKLADMNDRKLFTIDPMRIMGREFRTRMPEYNIEYSFSAKDLVSNKKIITMNALIHLFNRFNWNLTNDDLHKIIDSMPYIHSIR